MNRISATTTLSAPLRLLPSSCSVPTRRRYPGRANHHSKRPNLKPLTSRIVLLTRHRQLDQIVEEVEAAKRLYGRLNTIVMNSVLEACVHCGDVDLALRMFNEMGEPGGCGVDSITYATILKGLGKVRRIDEAFQIMESIEKGTAAGNPKLSSSLVYGLLDALINAGDLRRANGLLARYGTLLLQHGGPSILLVFRSFFHIWSNSYLLILLIIIDLLFKFFLFFTVVFLGVLWFFMLLCFILVDQLSFFFFCGGIH